MSEPVFHSALAARPEGSGAQGLSIALREIGDRGMIDLRGELKDESFSAAVSNAIGFALPSEPRTSRRQGETAALWLSTDQWLITAPRPVTGALHARLAVALGSVHSLCVDMSDARTILRLEGDNVVEVLNKGTSADFTDLKEGAVRRLRYAEIAALVHVIGREPDVMDLYVFRSYADYAWTYLITTAREAARIQLFGRQPSLRQPDESRGPA
ncbi:MAG TPA: sarcosine oxidase subunit gamma family protein [Aestuariivirgaceae bacterium]|nr:sarcosine oxidase subunit gamma family protein [Aestuariivirgaceae bacterium]